MTNILCNWLNSDVKLGVVVGPSSFKQDFSNGYLIGELLHKYHLQDDFDQFSRGSSAESKLNNFTRLEPILKLLDVPFNPNLARDIMSERHGVATRLLYHLFIALNRRTEQGLTNQSLEMTKPKERIDPTLYRRRLAQQTQRQDLDFEALVKRFQERQKQQEEMISRTKHEGEISFTSVGRPLSGSRVTVDKLNPIKTKQPPLRTTKLSNSGKRRDAVHAKEAEEMRLSIRTFEETLKTAIPPPPISATADSMVGTGIKLAMSKSDDDYVNKIHSRLHEETNARKEREKRRRRVLIDQLKAHELKQEAKREEMLVNHLLRQSQQEKRIGVQLMQVRHEKEVIRQNRILLSHQYQERRMKDFIDALDRESVLARKEKEEYADQLQKEKELHEKLTRERKQKHYEKCYGICYEVLLQIVDLASKSGEYRNLTEKAIPDKLMREWKALFLVGKPLYDEEDSPEGSVCSDDEKDEESQKRLELLNDQDFSEYKNTLAEWQAPEDLKPQADEVKENAILGHVIQRVYNIVYPPESEPPPPQFPEFPVKACFLGKMFSGKTTAMNQLCAKHRLQPLCVDDLVRAAVEAFEKQEPADEEEEAEEIQRPREQSTASATELIPKTASKILMEPIAEGHGPHDREQQSGMKKDSTFVSEMKLVTIGEADQEHQPKSESAATSAEEAQTEHQAFATDASLQSADTVKLSLKARLGELAYQQLLQGRPVDDQTTVRIIAHGIRQVPPGTGWILDGFPTTLKQARLLEKALTGFEAPKKSRHSLSRTPVPAIKSRLAASKRSMLVPGKDTPETAPPPVSGIDIVICFGVTDDVAMQRAAGRKVDPQTGEGYHQELKQPPEGSVTGVGNVHVLVPAEDPNFDQQQLQNRLSHFEGHWPKIESWFEQFNNIVYVDAAKPQDVVSNSVECLLEGVIHRREEANIKKAEEAAEQEAKEGIESQERAQSADSVSQVEGTGRDSETKEEPTVINKKLSTIGETSENDAAIPESVVTTPVPASGEIGLAQQPDTVTVSAVMSTMPEPGSDEWEYISNTIDEDLAQYLAFIWDKVEDNYLKTCKAIFKELRVEYENIIQYFYHTKKAYIEFLERPDHKQTFVTQWQKMYNEEIADDMRADGDMKAELHQQSEDLKERLWDICDHRRDEAEEERQLIISEQWLEDHLGLIINQYISLIQNEVDRYQHSLQFLRDYYLHMEGKPVGGSTENYHRLPLLDIGSMVQEGEQPSEEKALPHPDGPAEDGTETQESVLKRRIPLVKHHQAKSPETSQSAIASATTEPAGASAGVERKKRSSKKDKEREAEKEKEKEKEKAPVPVTPLADEKLQEEELGPQSEDSDEQLILDAYHSAVTMAKNLASSEEQPYLEPMKSRERESSLLEDDKKQSKGQKSQAKKNSKLPKGSGKKDKGRRSASSLQSTDAEVSSTTDATGVEKASLVTMSQVALADEKKKEHIKVELEHLASVQMEEKRVKFRIELIRHRSITVIQEIKNKANTMWELMKRWQDKRFSAEMDSIDYLLDMISQAIENETTIQQALTLHGPDFTIAEDIAMMEELPPPRPVTPPEDPMCDSFTVHQLLNLKKQLAEVAPSGVVSYQVLIQKLEEFQSLSYGEELLPEYWVKAPYETLEEIVMCLVPPESDYLDWRHFLVLVALPWPPATQQSLLETLERFIAVDTAGKGYLTWEQYCDVQLWYHSQPRDHDAPYDPSVPVKYDRDYSMQLTIFDLFKETLKESKSVEVLDYVTMLLHFCVDTSPALGLMKALSVATGQLLPLSIAVTNNEAEEDAQETETGTGSDCEIPLDAFVRVLHLGKASLGYVHRYRETTDPSDALSRDRIAKAYARYEAGPDRPLPVSIFQKDSIIVDCIQACKRYKLVDFRSMVAPSALQSEACHSTN